MRNSLTKIFTYLERAIYDIYLLTKTKTYVFILEEILITG